MKGKFTRRYANRQKIIPASRIIKREQAVWQRRFWEHLIRDQDDFNRLCDYIHYNPVKHGLAKSPSEWPYSTFSEFVTQGLYPREHDFEENEKIKEMHLE